MAQETTHLISPILLVLLASGKGLGRRAEGRAWGRGEEDGEVRWACRGLCGGEGEEQGALWPEAGLGHFLRVATKSC